MVDIRTGEIQDVPRILDIYNHAIQTSTATFDLEPQTLEQRTEWFSHYGDMHPLLVAIESDRVIGYACISPFRAKPAYAKTVEISVYIDPEHWGKGVGRTLMQEIIREAKRMGYHTIVAGITAGNDTSVRLHERFGFRLVARFHEVGFKFGAWQDVLFYQLMLTDSTPESPVT